METITSTLEEACERIIAEEKEAIERQKAEEKECQNAREQERQREDQTRREAVQSLHSRIQILLNKLLATNAVQALLTGRGFLSLLSAPCPEPNVASLVIRDRKVEITHGYYKDKGSDRLILYPDRYEAIPDQLFKEMQEIETTEDLLRLIVRATHKLSARLI